MMASAVLPFLSNGRILATTLCISSSPATSLNGRPAASLTCITCTHESCAALLHRLGLWPRKTMLQVQQCNKASLWCILMITCHRTGRQTGDGMQVPEHQVCIGLGTHRVRGKLQVQWLGCGHQPSTRRLHVCVDGRLLSRKKQL